MKQVFQENKRFYLTFLVFLVLGGIFLSVYTQTATHLLFNAWHTSFGDLLFPYLTHLGDGWVLAALALIVLLFHSYYAALVATVSFVGTSFTTQFLKRVIFTEAPRPKSYFQESDILHFVEGVQVHCCNSFPSGHTMAAFALFSFIALFVKNKAIGWLFCIAALTIGFSRIYLQQHFFVDVYVGAILGTSLTTVTYMFTSQSKTAKHMIWQGALLKGRK